MVSLRSVLLILSEWYRAEVKVTTMVPQSCTSSDGPSHSISLVSSREKVSFNPYVITPNYTGYDADD